MSDTIELKGYQLMLIDFLTDAGKGDFKAWPEERLELVGYLLETMSAEDTAQIMHYYLAQHLNAAFLMKKAIYCGLLHGQDGGTKQ